MIDRSLVSLSHADCGACGRKADIVVLVRLLDSDTLYINACSYNDEL